MKQNDREREVDIRQAALWLGCSPQYLLDIKRRGWLQSDNELAGKRDEKRHKATFWIWQLEILSWDLAYSLSLYDIAEIRSSGEDERVLARQRGIPVGVVLLVRRAYVFGWMLALCQRYATRRGRKTTQKADVELPIPACPFTLPKLLEELSARDRVLFARQPARKRYGPQGLLRRKPFAGIQALWTKLE